jgi:twinkle protein
MSNIIDAHLPCPNPRCLSSDALASYDDGHLFCFSCNTYFPPNNKGEFIIDDFTYEYLPWRHISRETYTLFNVKTKITANGEPVEIGFPYSNGSYKVRKLASKDFRWQGESVPGLFGLDKFSAGSHKYVTITEGELDACSLFQVLHSPVVSVRSASSAVSDITAERSWLNSHERIYLAFDADAAGKEAVARVARLFDYNKIYVVKFTKYKDANDYLQAGEYDELRNIWWNSHRYQPDNIISTFDEFKEVLQNNQRNSVSYPYPTINRMTYGIRTGESILITAPEGVGKTELMHALEYHILKETDANVGAIFLEEPKARHLQALAGVCLQQPAHLTEWNGQEDRILLALHQLIQKDDRLHVYSHFGSDDPESILDTIRFLVSARGCRYIFFDHITMAVSGLAGENERKALDYLATRLEMMVKELDFALIVVSHINDEGLTRGSRLISKVADIRIDLSRDVDNNDVAVYLRVRKNRFSGITGYAGKLIFNPNTRIYKEEIEDVFIPGEEIPLSPSQEGISEEKKTVEQTHSTFSLATVE